MHNNLIYIEQDFSQSGVGDGVFLTQLEYLIMNELYRKKCGPYAKKRLPKPVFSGYK